MSALKAVSESEIAGAFGRWKLAILDLGNNPWHNHISSRIYSSRYFRSLLTVFFVVAFAMLWSLARAWMSIPPPLREKYIHQGQFSWMLERAFDSEFHVMLVWVLVPLAVIWLLGALGRMVSLSFGLLVKEGGRFHLDRGLALSTLTAEDIVASTVVILLKEWVWISAVCGTCYWAWGMGWADWVTGKALSDLGLWLLMVPIAVLISTIAFASIICMLIVAGRGASFVSGVPTAVVLLVLTLTGAYFSSDLIVSNYIFDGKHSWGWSEEASVFGDALSLNLASLCLLVFLGQKLVSRNSTKIIGIVLIILPLWLHALFCTDILSRTIWWLNSDFYWGLDNRLLNWWGDSEYFGIGLGAVVPTGVFNFAVMLPWIGYGYWGPVSHWWVVELLIAALIIMWICLGRAAEAVRMWKQDH